MINMALFIISNIVFINSLIIFVICFGFEYKKKNEIGIFRVLLGSLVPALLIYSVQVILFNLI